MGLTVEKCLQAWTNSLRQMKAKADIVFFGDSLTYYGDFSKAFPDKVVCNLGLRGDTIQGMIDRVEQVFLLDPMAVFIMAGINDVETYNKEQFHIKYHNLIDVITKNLPNCKLIIQTMLPVNCDSFDIRCSNARVKTFNDVINSISVEYNLPLIDLYASYENGGMLPHMLTTDGIHLKLTSYDIWYSVIKHIHF